MIIIHTPHLQLTEETELLLMRSATAAVTGAGLGPVINLQPQRAGQGMNFKLIGVVAEFQPIGAATWMSNEVAHRITGLRPWTATDRGHDFNLIETDPTAAQLETALKMWHLIRPASLSPYDRLIAAAWAVRAAL